MPPRQTSLPSDSIKVVPGRSKLRVESSNPVPRQNNIPIASKVKLISPEEAIKLASGVTQMAVSPISKVRRPKSAQDTSQVRKRSPVHRISEAPRLVRARLISETPTPDVASNPTTGFREIVSGLRALSATTTTEIQRTNLGFHQSKTVKPPSPRALQIRSRVKQQACNATQVVQGSVVEVGDKAKDYGTNEIRQSISDVLGQTNAREGSDTNFMAIDQDLATSVEQQAVETPLNKATNTETCREIRQSIFNEELEELLRYRPMMHPTWKGRIMDSATPPEFDCEFWAKPASTISRKANRLLKAMPELLKVELLPTCHIQNDEFQKSPTLMNAEMYLFPDETNTEKFEGDHAHLLEVISSRNAMIKVSINGNKLLIFSSKVLDTTSQFLINKQMKTENFLWGFFLQSEKSIAIVPGTAYQTEKDRDYGDAVDMNLDIKYPSPSVALKLIAESQNTPLTSAEKKNSEVSIPPGFEKSIGIVSGTAYQNEKDCDYGDAVDMDLDINYPNLSAALKLIAELQNTPLTSAEKKNSEVSIPPGFGKSIGIVPGTAYRTDKDCKYGDAADMDVNIEYPIPSVALKRIAESQSTPLTSANKKNSEVSVPPGFEKLWTPPLVKLNIQGTSNSLSNVFGYAGLVRNQSGKWVFGYSRCHTSISEVAAGLLAIYHGLKILWDSGFRRIRLETTSSLIIDALTANSDLFRKRKSILGACMDMILKDWKCDVYLISKEQNLCAEWLANRLEDQPRGLVFFEYPPQGLMDLLEKDRLAAAI